MNGRSGPWPVRVLLDTSVILDVLLARAPHVTPATAVLDLVAVKDLDGLIAATTVTTIHYLATNAAGRLKVFSPDELVRFMRASEQC